MVALVVGWGSQENVPLSDEGKGRIVALRCSGPLWEGRLVLVPAVLGGNGGVYALSPADSRLHHVYPTGGKHVPKLWASMGPHSTVTPVTSQVP